LASIRFSPESDIGATIRKATKLMGARRRGARDEGPGFGIPTLIPDPKPLISSRVFVAFNIGFGVLLRDNLPERRPFPREALTTAQAWFPVEVWVRTEGDCEGDCIGG